MAKAPDLVGSNEDIENLTKFKDDIIDLIATDILLKRAPEERTPLSEARKEAYDIYAKALNEIQTKNWEKITTRFSHDGDIYTSEYTPAQQFVLSPTDNTFGRGVGSTATTSAHVINCGISRFSVTDQNGNSKVLCEGVLHHGALSAYGLVNSEERAEANRKRGEEVLIAMLLNNPEKLQRAFDGEVVKLRFPSISLMTPANVKGPGFTSIEQTLLDEQMRVWEALSSASVVELTIVDANGQPRIVSVDVEVAAFSVGVNNLALGPWKLGQDVSDQYNKEAARKLLGDLEKSVIGGWVGEYLDGSNITNREEVVRTAIELKMAFRNKEYHHSNGDPYRVPVLIAILSQMIGLDRSCVNCKSAKDRTALAVAEINYALAKKYRNLQSGEEDRVLLALAILDRTHRDIQQWSTGHPGNKAVTENKFTKRRLAELFFGETGMRKRIRNSRVVEVLVGESGQASKDKKKKSEPLEPNPISRQGSVATEPGDLDQEYRHSLNPWRVPYNKTARTGNRAARDKNAYPLIANTGLAGNNHRPLVRTD